MSAAEVIALARRRGVRLEAHDGRIVCSGLKGALSPELRAALAESKDEILVLLGGLPDDVHAWPEPWRELYQERAAIRQYDGGLPRDEAERLAEEDVRRVLT